MMSVDSCAQPQARVEELLAKERSGSIRDLVSEIEASFAVAQEFTSVESVDETTMS